MLKKWLSAYKSSTISETRQDRTKVTSVVRYHGTTAAPRYHFSTVPVPSALRYYLVSQYHNYRGSSARYYPMLTHSNEHLLDFIVFGFKLQSSACRRSFTAKLHTFLPARRYASAGYRDRNVSVRPSVCPSVRLSVRLSVTRRYCVKTKKASVMISSPSVSPKTLVF